MIIIKPVTNMNAMKTTNHTAAAHNASRESPCGTGAGTWAVSGAFGPLTALLLQLPRMALARALGLFVCLGACAVSRAAWHPDNSEPGLLAHFVAGGHEPVDGMVEDQTHNLSARVTGPLGLTTIGPLEGVVFNGKDSWLEIDVAAPGVAAKLPVQAFTVSAWVNLSEMRGDGSVAGLTLDNGGREYGWTLGYDRERFMFSLASKGGDDGDGKLTPIRGTTVVGIGQWYYIVGTYDGKEQRLYVNGELEASSTQQSGDILYPPPESGSKLTIGCYLDDNEKHPFNGALYEVKLYNVAVPPEKIKAAAEKSSNAVAWRPPLAEELSFLVKPYLQFATLDSMVVMCETSRPTTMRVEYGGLLSPSGALLGINAGTSEKAALSAAGSVTTSEPKFISEAKIQGLTQATAYLYRVTCTDDRGRVLTAPIATFQTAVGPESAYAFTVIGDTQRNPEVTRRVSELAFGMRPNFQIHCGDVVDDGYSKAQWLKDLFEPSSVLTAHVPVFPTIGNHEDDSHWYYDYFSLPRPEYYYTFKFGNCQFFMVDSNRDLSPGSEQYQWLERELGSSTAEWKFTCHHHPCFSSDSDDYGDTMKGPSFWGDRNARKVVELYERFGVDVAFNGHIHVYERTWPIYQMKVDQDRGVRYITSGGGGGGLEKAAPQRTWFSLHFNPAHHFCYVALQGKTIQFKAFDVEGRLFDTYEMTKP